MSLNKGYFPNKELTIKLTSYPTRSRRLGQFSILFMPHRHPIQAAAASSANLDDFFCHPTPLFPGNCDGRSVVAFNERVFLKVINLVPPESLVVVVVVVIVVVVGARQKLRLCPSAPSQKREFREKMVRREVTEFQLADPKGFLFSK